MYYGFLFVFYSSYEYCFEILYGFFSRLLDV